MFFIGLVNHYADVLPPTIAKKKPDTECKVPLRKRTVPIDMRMSRTRLSSGNEARDWLAGQRAQGNVAPPAPPPCSTRTFASPNRSSLGVCTHFYIIRIYPSSHAACSRPPSTSTRGGEADAFTFASAIACPRPGYPRPLREMRMFQLGLLSNILPPERR